MTFARRPRYRARFQDFAPDVVLHLAAQSLVTRSYREPVLTFQTNVMGTVHVMEAVRRTPSVRSVVIVTTDKCYENREWPWAYREDDTLGGYDPYSSSKACAELAVAAWRRSYFPALEGRGVSMASARAGNVIGGGDWAEDRLIPLHCVRALSSGASIAIRNPSATRPWQHVLEPLCGYLLLAEGLWKGETDLAAAWNFGPAVQDVKPVRHIVECVTALWARGQAGPRSGELDCMRQHCSPSMQRKRAHASIGSPVLAWRTLLPGASAGTRRTATAVPPPTWLAKTSRRMR